MQIQEDSPRVHNPLATLEEDYELSVLHLAWEERDGTDERRLLFGMVELLPIEVPPPLDDGLQWTALEGGSAVRIYVRRVVVSAKRALSWYLDCRRGFGVVPTEAGELLDPEQGAVRFKLADLGEEPPWPTLVCISGESPTTPFCPAWHESPRVHHLIPLSEQGPSRLWLKERMRAHATQWLSERLHFKLDDYPEYWGSIHLVAPNPVFRGWNQILMDKNSPKESIMIRMQPRMGKSIKGLQLTFTEQEPWGVLDRRSVKLDGDVLRFDFDRPIGAWKLDIFDEQRGALVAPHQAAPFLRSIQFSLELGGAVVQVTGDSPADSYEVTRTNKELITSSKIQLASHSKVAPARLRMNEALTKREQRSTAHTRDQRWFADERHEAANALRKHIHDAQHAVFLIDSSFDNKDLKAFAPAVAQEHVPVSILCGELFLRQIYEPPMTGLLRGQALLESLLDIRSKLPASPIEIRVMLGDPPPIQDVLLGVDQNWWLLGSRFRTFGERGSLLSRIAEPSTVQEHVRKVWEDSVELARWVGAITQQLAEGI